MQPFRSITIRDRYDHQIVVNLDAIAWVNLDYLDPNPPTLHNSNSLKNYEPQAGVAIYLRVTVGSSVNDEKYWDVTKIECYSEQAEQLRLLLPDLMKSDEIHGSGKLQPYLDSEDELEVETV